MTRSIFCALLNSFYYGNHITQNDLTAPAACQLTKLYCISFVWTLDRSQTALNTNLRATLDQLFLEIPKLARLSSWRDQRGLDRGSCDENMHHLGLSRAVPAGTNVGVNGYPIHFNSLNRKRNCQRLRIAVESSRITEEEYQVWMGIK